MQNGRAVNTEDLGKVAQEMVTQAVESVCAASEVA
jgi:hypothetical protein